MKNLKFICVPIISFCLCVLFGVFYSVYYFFIDKQETAVVYASAPDIAEVQRRLKAWGYYGGEITGVNDWETQQAIKYFQRVHDIAETGKIDYATASAIGVSLNSQNSNDLYLLAKCIYAEARGEVYVGKVAVGAVILNRVASPDFPNTVYGVIYQPWAFTAVHDGQINLEPDTEAYQAAQDALSGWDPSYGSLYYYNPAVATSSWIWSRQTVVTIGNHIFAI